MNRLVGPLSELRASLRNGSISTTYIAGEVIASAASSVSRNTYLGFSAPEVLAEAKSLKQRYPTPVSRPLLYGVPVSIKDCFDVKGKVTTFGARFYAEQTVPATKDSALVRRLRDLGCLLTGKTNLNPLAYGITGENPDFGDCVQPRDTSLLTGGSSSGAAASVQEGSAHFAIGTDTGGSIRVPAALCGLIGYRASHSIAATDGLWPDLWQGARHLAPSFDTPGLLIRDLADTHLLVSAVFGIPASPLPSRIRIGIVHESFLSEAEPEVRSAFYSCPQQLTCIPDVETEIFSASQWPDSVAIFTSIQAHEAATQHAGHLNSFPSEVSERLRWGASITKAELDLSRLRQKDFLATIDSLFDRFDILVLPVAPVSRLLAGADHRLVRPAILRYTTPFSLAGLPVLTIPGERLGAHPGTGIQLAAASGRDALLLACCDALSTALKGG